jgi:hypothetical protein
MVVCILPLTTGLASKPGPQPSWGLFFVRSLPRRLERRHRFLTARRIASIMRVLRHPRRDIQDQGMPPDLFWASLSKIKSIRPYGEHRRQGDIRMSITCTAAQCRKV